MSDRALLVDLENVQKIDLSVVPSDTRILIFHGTIQKKLPLALVKQAQPLGTRLQWIEISGNGPNALDFHIAFYLGQETTRCPASECIVYSQDTGFDPLVRHLEGLGHKCRRVTTLNGAFPELPATASTDAFDRLLMLLGKDKARPARRRTLMSSVKSWFPQLTDEAHSALVDRLFKEAHVSEQNQALRYRI